MLPVITMVVYPMELDAQLVFVWLRLKRYTQLMLEIPEQFWVEKDMLCLFRVIINLKIKVKGKEFKQLEEISSMVESMEVWTCLVVSAISITKK